MARALSLYVSLAPFTPIGSYRIRGAENLLGCVLSSFAQEMGVC